MIPYYDQSGITIYNGDCLDVLRTLPDESIGAVVTDPPYGIDYQSAHKTNKSDWKPKIKNDKTPFIWWLWDAFRLTSSGGCVLCFCRWDTSHTFHDAIDAAGYDVMSQVIWDRCHHGMGDLKSAYGPQHDVIWFAIKGDFVFPGQRPVSVMRAQRLSGDELLHPNEKPVPLLAQMISDVTMPSMVVLDPMMGIGSTLVAARLRGRRAIGIEIEEKYCEIAAKRLQQGAFEWEST